MQPLLEVNHVGFSYHSESGETTLFASDQPDDFGVMAGHFLQEKLTRPVLPVNIDRY